MHTLGGGRAPRVYRVRPWVVGLLGAALLGLCLVAVPAEPSARAAGLSSICGNPAPPSGGQLRHIVVVVMENESQSNIIGSPSAPYQTGLAQQCGSASQMYAITHPSLQNYLSTLSGAVTFGAFHDCVPKPATHTCMYDGENVFHQLTASGQSWKNYAEDMTTTCQRTKAGYYVPRHNPAPYFTDLTDCSARNVIMGSITTRTGAFYDDLRAGTLPAFSFISPNVINDGHDSSAADGDAYLRTLVPLIAGGPNYQAGDTAIVVTYDEGKGSDHTTDENCTDQARDLAGLQPSCNIPFIVAAPYTVPGTTSSAFCTLWCLTRTVEETFGLPLLGHAADANVRNLGAEFNLTPAPTPTCTTSTTTSDTTSTTTSDTTSTTTSDTTTDTSTSTTSDPTSSTTTDTTTDPSSSTTSETNPTTSDPGPTGNHAGARAAGGGYTECSTQTSGTSSTSATSSSTTTTQTTSGTSTTSTAPPGSRQYVTNTSLEGGDLTGWKGSYNGTSKVTAVQPAGGARDGSWALMVRNSGAAAAVTGVKNAQPLWVDGTRTPTVAGTTYTASAWVSGTSGTSARWRLQDCAAGGTTCAAAVIGPAVKLLTGRWVQVTFAITIPTSGHSIVPALVSTSLPSGASFLADSFSLTAPS